MRMPSLIGRICTACACKQLDDPVFGHLRRRHGACWEADTVSLTAPDHLLVEVFAPDSGPTEVQREMFGYLREHFRELKDDITDPLYEKYRRVREFYRAQYAGKPYEPDFPADFPCIARPADIWCIAHLFRIDLFAKADVDLVFDYAMQWENDHHLDVMLKHWQVVDVAMDGCDG